VISKFIEANNGPLNWGKFALLRWNERELRARSAVDGRFLVLGRGWTPAHVWVLDLQTGEGVCVRPGGNARVDLTKHQIWCCPLFEPFLEWLYHQDLSDLCSLPERVDLPRAPFEYFGWRRDRGATLEAKSMISAGYGPWTPSVHD